MKRDLVVLVLAARDPAVPLTAKVLAGVVAAYALSPIDLIPDFIPVLGMLDDLLLVPVGIWLVLRLIPPRVQADLRERAAAQGQLPRSRAAATVIVALWILGSVWLGLAAHRYLQRGA
ncbi:YkvA family protein [Novosphingobium sp.]|uniref:YkvA family protein n=1 Tax=Novosphingobium sp. TaxID=1874826 RepID=UPI0038621400